MKGETLLNLVFGLLVLALLASVGYMGIQYLGRLDVKVGSLVQTTFTGNPAFLTSALLGPRGELAASVSNADLTNLLYCDVPGSAGAYSSWYRPAGANASNTSAIQSSYTTHNNVKWSCTQDSDCAAMPWIPCGASAACMTNQPWSLASATTLCCSTDGTSECSATSLGTVCVVTSKTDTEAGVPLYVCNSATHLCQYGSPGPSSSVSCGAWGPCGSGTIPNGACNTFTGACVVDAPEHVLLNIPWRAEGSVTGSNSDGTFNVLWTRVQCLYDSPGPVLSSFPSNFVWNYQNCRFIANASDPVNVAATAYVLGTGNADVAGLPTASSAPASVFNTPDATLGYGWMGPQGGGLPSGVDPDTSAWNLTNHGLSPGTKLGEIVRISAYSIAPYTASTFDPTLLASMTTWRTTYMGNRPPHLQIH